MSSTAKRHPFLDDLSDDVVLVSSILRKPVVGRPLVLKVVKAAAQLYIAQTPRFLGSVDNRIFFEYEVRLADGVQASGFVSATKNETGEVVELNITFSPLGGVLALAAGLRQSLSEVLGPENFL